MKKVVLFFLVAALTLVAVPRGGAFAQSMDTAVKLAAQNGSGEDGSATITAMGDNQIKITIKVANGTATPQPAHIHKGTCANLDPVPAYPLNNVVNGMSETVVNVGMAQLAQGQYAINIHKSAAEVSTYVSCGDIVPMNMGGGTPGGTTGGQTGGHEVMMMAQNGSGEDGTATIIPMGDNSVQVVLKLANGTTTPQPAHIHKGTCANLNPVPAFPLTNAVNGMSDTTVPVGWAELAQGGYAINVHKSAAEVSTYVSCGDIMATSTGGQTGGNTGGNLKDQIMTVKLAEQNNSGEYGGARITWVSENQVRVEVTVVGGSATPQPAHIHKGSCANLDPVPAFPLNNVVNGMSDTTVNVGMAELAKGGYAINLHKSAAEVSTYVSCGNIEPLTIIAPPPGGTGGQGGSSPGMPTTGAGDQINLLLGLTLLALLIMGAGLTLVRHRA
jgi:hypothetical protein